MTKLLYVGKDYKGFRKEAEKHGVNRNIPFSQAMGLDWGEWMVTAWWESYTEWGMDCSDEPRLGDAHLLVGFFLKSIAFQDEEMTKRILEHVEVKKRIRKQETVDKPVKRHCGQYSIKSTTYVDMELKDIMVVAREVSETMQKKPRVMVGGPADTFYPETATERAVPFTRGVLNLEEYSTRPAPVNRKDGTISVLSTYNQYHTEQERKDSRNHKLEDFGLTTKKKEEQ